MPGKSHGRTLGARFVVMALLAGTSVGAQTFSPAVFRDGQLPTQGIRSVGVGGGQVLVEVTVGVDGSVSVVRSLRETAMFTERLIGAVRTWRFAPAQESVASVESKVLVAGVFRAPTFTSPTLGEPIRDAGAPSEEVPFPLTVAVPPFPPLARDPGVVLIEARVDPNGTVVDARVRQPSPPFDDPALGAARQWRFRPARVRGKAVASLVYIVFAFPVPVV